MNAIRTFFTSDAWRRTWRTFAQAFVAILIVSFSADAVPDPATLLDVLSLAGWAGVVAVVTLAHNELETLAPRIDTREPKAGK